MKDQSMTEQALTHEVNSLRRRIAELEQSESERKPAEEALRKSEGLFRIMAEEMAVIAEITRVISSTLKIDEVYERFAAEAKKLIPFDSLAINLYNSKENSLRVAHVSGVDIECRKRGDPLVVEGSLSETVILAQTGLCIQPANIEEIVNRFPRLSPIFQAGLRSILCVSIVSRDEVIGVLHFRSKTPNAYEEKDLKLAERIGAQIAGAIANEQLFLDLEQAKEALQRARNELERRVADRTDELTRVNNELRTEITERKRAEEALRESETRYKQLFENAPAGIYEIDLTTGRMLSVNDEMCEYTGYTKDELLSLSALDLLTEESQKIFIERMAGYAAGEPVPATLEYQARTKSGREFWMSVNPKYFYKEGIPVRASVVAHDITERKQAEKALRESEARWQFALEGARDGLWDWDALTNKVYFSDHWKAMLGYDRDEIGDSLDEWDRRVHPDDKAATYADLERHFRRETEIYQNEHRLLCKDGSYKWILDRGKVIEWTEDGKPRRVIGTHTDITERKKAEDAIAVAIKDWENTFDTVTDMVTIHDKDFNIIRANKAARELLGLQLPEKMPSVKCFRCYHGTDKPPSGCASCESLQTGIPSTVEVFEPHLNKQLEIRAMPRFGSDGRLVGLIHVVRDITERKKAEEQLKHTLESLRKAFGTTVQVMVSAVETRDPYTSGHQIRSANIARAIATEMGLSLETIDGLRMAGSIHDIGKLSIPAEILSKPGKISAIEFSLIKEHARKGFEMLKDVKSPWPLAEIVYQHHERMDGSGYPRNLKEDEILMEARIMAVADVVESMASHRPYRPALGINAALEEIEKNKGKLYDTDVVNACLRLFREKSFQIDGA